MLENSNIGLCFHVLTNVQETSIGLVYKDQSPGYAIDGIRHFRSILTLLSFVLFLLYLLNTGLLFVLLSSYTIQ
jgi:hypothetical protein